jgi:hypothetical protein
MFSGIRDWLELRRLQAQKRRTQLSYRKDIQDARTQKLGRAEVEKLERNEMSEVGWIQDEIAELQTRRLFRRAEKYLVPTPEFDRDGPNWSQSQMTGEWHLTRVGLAALRAAIRQEQKERREAVQGRLIWISMLTGLIGALTGLASVLHKSN